MLEFFPKYKEYDIEVQNPQIQIYGHRIYKDQTLYEYLLEFLLVFISPKSEGMKEYDEIKSEGFYFNEIKEEIKQFHYYPAPKMGLKRFIFFNRSDQEKRFEIDSYALEHHREHLKQTIQVEGTNYDKEFALDVLQDLFYGYNAIIGKRSWFAQSLLPLAPEIIFSESIGNKKTRTENLSKESFLKIDKEFDFSKHMFMARGGEVYYLHVLQGLSQLDTSCRDELSDKLKDMITSIPQLSALANYIQGGWEEIVDAPDNQAKFHYLVKKMEVIPKDYENVALYTVKELNNLLCSELDAFEKVELVGNLLAIQIIRMMTYRSTKVLNLQQKQPWVIDLTENTQGSIRKKAIQGYEQLEENVFRAIYHVFNDEMTETKKNVLPDAAKDTSLLIRKLGKDIGLVIPPTGGRMRMALNENLVKILVLSLIRPGERLLFTTFIQLCYEHYNIVIGPKVAEQHFEDISYLNDFNENELVFLELLRNCGFLRNLSDATSIVENPFKG